MNGNNAARQGWHDSHAAAPGPAPPSAAANQITARQLEPRLMPRFLRLPAAALALRPRSLGAGLCALSLLAGSPAPAQGPPAPINLPALGDSVSDDFGPNAERRLGEQVMRDIRRDPDYLDDPLLLEYVQSIWQPLLAAAVRNGNIGAELGPRFAWEAFLVRDRSVNAFALPGGFIGVHLGLIAMTASRDELASVLAHELSHVTQRHIARGMVNQGRQSLLSTAAMIIGILAAARMGNADVANAAIVGGQAGAIQGMLNFSRDMEREADRIGFAVLTGAGFSPAGMAAMFEKLDAASRLNDNNSFPYLRTHPLTTDRIGEARARLGPAGAPAPASRLEHEVMRARARVLMDPREESLRRTQLLDAQAGSGSPSERVAALAASAQASLQLRDLPRADAAIDAALRLVAGSPSSDARALRAVRLLQAQALLVRGDAVRAATALRPYADEDSRPLLLMRTQVALGAAGAPAAGPEATQALRRSAEDLQGWVGNHAIDATAWSLLAQAWQRLGQPLRALRAEAESRAALGDIVGAVDRLRAGQNTVRAGSREEFIEASVIDLRLRELEAQRRQLAAELRNNR